MISVDNYTIEKECTYKDEHYSVRDNGAIMRYPKKGMRVRNNDYVWTFGKKNENRGYMEFTGEAVHRIVAFAFHGAPESEKLVVDHIDTNRCNNRPENLRWVTRLENVLNNPITRARIEQICGSVEAFLDNPSLLKGHENENPNFKWMRAVTPEEAKVTKERLENWAKNPSKPKGEGIGEWIYEEKEKILYDMYYKKTLNDDIKEEIQIEDTWLTNSLTPNAIQVDWATPSEFPCCPNNPSDNPIGEYLSNLKVNSIFCKNPLYSSLVLDSAITDGGESLWVMTRSGGDSVKPWALAKIYFKDNVFYHENKRSFFDENGAKKYFTLAQGKEWTGGDVFDDFC